MKILLDECITKQLKKHLEEFEVFTVRELGLSGIENGTLMTYCVENGFDILLTIDKNLVFQQNIENYAIAVLILKAKTSKLEVSATLKILPLASAVYEKPCKTFGGMTMTQGTVISLLKVSV